MVHQLGAKVPEWYAGQCPLIDRGTVILAPGGPEALLAAVDSATGRVLWQTPNPKDWKMTHSSLVSMEFAGQRQYVYCAKLGVVGVAAEDGRLLRETPDWKISIATVPSPLT
jgi:outer membrane protein assembly factor BamB